ncbi:hypothetical protein Tco_0689763 [Tanacetum coccineum]
MSLGKILPPWHQFLDQKIRGAHFSLGIVAGERFAIELTPSTLPQRHFAGDRFPQRHVAGEKVGMLLEKASNVVVNQAPFGKGYSLEWTEAYWSWKHCLWVKLWWNEARGALKYGELGGDLYDATSSYVNDYLESQIVLDMRRCNRIDSEEYNGDDEEGGSRGEHYDTRNVGNFVAAEDNKADLFPLQVCLSISRATTSLIVRISQKGNMIGAFKKSCQIFSVNSRVVIEDVLAVHICIPGMIPSQASQATILPQAFHTMTPRDPNGNMNTGASSHLADNTTILTSFSNSSMYPSVFVGNGHSIPVTHTGHSFLHTSSKPLHLNYILVTPHIIKNLISVRQFTRDNDVSVEFDAYGFSVKDYQTGRLLLRCDSTGDLYPVIQQTSSQTPVVLLSFSSTTWHIRLGHPGDDVLRRLESRNLISCRKYKLICLSQCMSLVKTC